ncbi:MAG TPA: hypothetical protein VNU68_21265 [Verrucomicrobiae bacterium]|nr:hypothetical protein [Verrucomicrobiae bacterium]
MSNTYPDCYLHVEECRSGETWIVPLRGNSKLDLKESALAKTTPFKGRNGRYRPPEQLLAFLQSL